MDINLKVEALETLVNKHEKDIAALTETIGKLKSKLLLTQGAGALLDSDEEFDALKALLNSDAWPAAVEPNLICNTASDQDKINRANGILDIIIDIHLEKLHFLDFGCGEGHVVNQSVKQNPKLSVGFDIKHYPEWDKFEKTPQSMYATEWADVVKNGPYNVVLLYDVIDHLVEGEDDVVSQLKRLRKVLAPNAKIYVRCHPWVSRHATHLYHKINKAYIHLVFTEEELKQLGYEGMTTRKIIHPFSTYSEWFKAVGLPIKKEFVNKTSVENFFSKNYIVSKRIKANWKNSTDPELRSGTKFPWQLELQFVDYVLKGK